MAAKTSQQFLADIRNGSPTRGPSAPLRTQPLHAPVHAGTNPPPAPNAGGSSGLTLPPAIAADIAAMIVDTGKRP